MPVLALTLTLLLAAGDLLRKQPLRSPTAELTPFSISEMEG